MEKDLIEYIAKSLVDDPSAVSVTETEGERGPVLELCFSRITEPSLFILYEFFTRTGVPVLRHGIIERGCKT